MGRMYKDEFCGEEYDYGEDDFVKPHITYDNKHYEIWTNAVRKRLTARMTYDSATSGMSERLIDPYQTSAPYGQGYCHLRKEVRKFRFDRIIDIELTNKTFIKPKNW